MVYRNKGKFILDKQHLQEIVDDMLNRRAYKDVSITINESPRKNSKSLYLYISIDDCQTCLRISDHRSNSDGVRQMIVCGSTGAANVYYKIERAIKDLRYKKLQSTLRTVGNGF